MSTQKSEAAEDLKSVLPNNTACRGVSTRRDPIPFDTGDERNYPKSIRWGKVRAIEDVNSELKYGNLTVELQSHEKIRWGDLSS